MKDEVVSFETAKLAKEKGFTEQSHSYYFEDGEFREFCINDTHGYYGDEYSVFLDELYHNWNDAAKTTKEGDRCWGCNKNPKYLETFSAPTQSLLQKWLREVHGLHVQPYFNINNHSETYFNNEILRVAGNKLEFDNFSKGGFFITYEEALEDGLIEALKLIDNE